MSETTRRWVTSIPSVGNVPWATGPPRDRAVVRPTILSGTDAAQRRDMTPEKRIRQRPRRKVAFVLGGGGHMGAHEVGMIRALLEREIRPDLVVGTSVGALNGAAVAARPDVEMVDVLESVWLNLDEDRVFGDS